MLNENESSRYSFKLLVSFLWNKGKVGVNRKIILRNLSLILNESSMNIQQTFTPTEVTVSLKYTK